MNYIINLIVSLAFIWITYLVYSIKQLKHEQISNKILIFVRRLLFYSSILIIFPLLIPNGLEVQHNLYLKDHKYLRVVQLIDQLSITERETLTAYINQEFSVKYKLMLLVPIILLLKEIYLIAQISHQESQGNECNNNLAISNEQSIHPIILQPKNVSEYITDKNEEISRIESYIRNNTIEKMRSIDEVKSSYLNNQSDLLNKLQFTIDSKRPEKILYSQYSNKQLANARHQVRIEESEQKSPNFKTIHSQVLIENSFSFDNQSKVDTIIQRRIKLIIGELFILQIIFGYTAGVQQNQILSILIIILSQCLIIDLFDDLMLVITKTIMGTCLLIFYLIFVVSMFLGMYFNQYIIQICYCIIIAYCIKPFINFFGHQTMKQTLIFSGISLILLIVIKLLLLFY